jgi:hypothetical protein
MMLKKILLASTLMTAMAGSAVTAGPITKANEAVAGVEKLMVGHENNPFAAIGALVLGGFGIVGGLTLGTVEEVTGN